ncbi:MAG TPA: sulfatase-like hydrolase/transferase [Candidatus Cryosericum sp.]|nr:sulfatase-like hydrolase/transferase [Candidatus Cryosericum sp.]
MASFSRHRLMQVWGLVSFLFVAALLGLLAWRLTPPGGPPLKRPRPGLVRSQIPEEASLVLITLDGLRTDRLGSYGEAPLSPTPHLDRLVSEGFRFEQAISPAPATFPAHVALLLGLSPAGRSEILDLGGTVPPGRATLAEILRSSGYRTAAFVGTSALGRATGLARGFDRFDEPHASDRPATARPLADRPAPEVVAAARGWLDENFRARFFLWVQIADPLPPHPVAAPRPLGRPREAYDAEVEQSDAEIGRLLARLSSLGVMGHTLVAVVSSHGIALGQHGETAAGLALYDESIRVPMALRLPGVGARDRSIPEQVRLFDLMPTLLDLLRLAAPEPPDGVSLVPLLDPGGELAPLPAVSVSVRGRDLLGLAPARALRSGGWKLIEGAADELYDLRRDPGEMRNLASTQRGRAAEMRRTLESVEPLASLMAPMAPARIATGSVPLLEEATVALRSGDGARARRALEDLRALLSQGAGRDAPPALLALLGAALRMQDRTAEALAVYEEALAATGAGTLPAFEDGSAAAASAGGVGRAPLVGLLQAEIGACRRRQGQREAAAFAYREAVAARPDDTDERLALGDLLTEMGHADEAIAELRAAQARSPGDPAVQAAMGRAYLVAGQPLAAILPLQDALRAAPWLVRPWYDLGQAYEALDRKDDARRAYQDFLARVQQQDDPLRALAGNRLRALQQGS